MIKNNLTDVSALAGLNQLTSLRLDGNQLTDEQLKHLAEFTQLTSLSLFNSQLTDLSPLLGLKQLTYLEIRSNPNLTKIEVEKLRKALPKCRDFISNPTK